MVSIIVPAYNSEKYLGACVESVISQSSNDWELLLVDDGSTDGTGALSDGYSRGDSRIRSVHRKNGGLSAARNTGIEAARGVFICFLDSDDVLAPEFIERVLKTQSETGAGIVAVCHREFEGRLPEWGQTGGGEEKSVVLNPKEAILTALYQRPERETGKRLDSSAWGKLYKRELWKEERFREGVWYEDLDVFYRIWDKAGKIAFVGEELHGYRQHGESFLHTVSLRRADVLDVTDRMTAYYEEEGKDEELGRGARTRRFAAHWNILLLLKRHKITQPEIEERCRKVIRGSRGEVLKNGRARLKDRLGALLGYLVMGGKR